MRPGARRTRRESTVDHSRAEPASNAPAANASIAVCAAGSEDTIQRRADELAAQLGLYHIDAADPAFDILLTVTVERLELRFPRPGGPGPMYVDFVGGPLGYARRVNRFGLLFQAVGFRHGRPSVLDATAGLGRDAFRLAYHGCQVTAVERSPILFALLKDGLARAMLEPEIAEKLGDRLRFESGDARDLMGKIAASDCPDVVYVDPMFPPKRKSALVKVEMRVLRQLVGDDLDARELFEAARTVARQRVVVKRHFHAEPIAPSPTHSLGDKTTRYDVYLRES